MVVTGAEKSPGSVVLCTVYQVYYQEVPAQVWKADDRAASGRPGA